MSQKITIKKFTIKKSEVWKNAAAAVAAAALFLGIIYGETLIAPAAVTNNPHEFAYYAGLSAVVLLMSFGVFAYIRFYYPPLFKRPKYLAMTFTALVLTFALCEFFGETVSPAARPVVLAVLLIAALVGNRPAMHANYFLNALILVVQLLRGGEDASFEFVIGLAFTGFITGTFAVMFASKNRRRIDYLVVGAYLAGISGLCALLAAWTQNTSASAAALFETAAYGALSSIFAVVIFLAVLPLFESGFNVVTSFRLGELSDHDRPLLRRLKELAPGTFNHSLVLGNIAETCALAIGESAYLARAAAYYHDIGKMKTPQYFVENLRSDANPHDEISPELSVSFLKKHVTNGAALAKEHRLPEEVINAVLEHHGTLPIKYFYYKAQKLTDGELDVEQYRYEGPKPTSKISAVIMIADACEAAIRSIKEASPAKIEAAVDAIIKERLDLNQFIDCDITMKDLEIIRNTVLSTFAGVYHERIEYPSVAVKR